MGASRVRGVPVPTLFDGRHDGDPEFGIVHPLPGTDWGTAGIPLADLDGDGDLDADGDLDLVIAGFWFENPGKGGGNWVRHNWPHLVIPNASHGTSIRS